MIWHINMSPLLKESISKITPFIPVRDIIFVKCLIRLLVNSEFCIMICILSLKIAQNKGRDYL
jgi:hypothetical protein